MPEARHTKYGEIELKTPFLRLYAVYAGFLLLMCEEKKIKIRKNIFPGKFLTWSAV